MTRDLDTLGHDELIRELCASDNAAVRELVKRFVKALNAIEKNKGIETCQAEL